MEHTRDDQSRGIVHDEIPSARPDIREVKHLGQRVDAKIADAALVLVIPVLADIEECRRDSSENLCVSVIYV